MGWLLRTSNREINVSAVYGPQPNNHFSLKIHHGGWFTKGPDVDEWQYMNGKVRYVDAIDGDEFSVLELTDMLKEIGYVKKTPMWYHFKEPESENNNVMHALGSDDDVRHLLKFVVKYKIIEVYVEQWKTNITPTLSSDANKDDDVIKEIDDALTEPFVPAKKMVPRKKLFIESQSQPMEPMHVDSQTGQDTQEIECPRNCRAKCDILLNNMCEVYNRQLIDGRKKPIILCLEFIREYNMKRLAKVQRDIDKSIGPLTPRATQVFDAIKTEATKYNATFNGNSKFQVVGPWMDQHVVDMDLKTCTCRRWELTGMPCKHGVATIFNMADNQQKVGSPESFVNHVYWLETWKTMYSFKIDPIKGRPHWPKSGWPITILPPKLKNPIGRPKKKRRKSAVEIQIIKEGKISRAGAKLKCGNCKVDGHNKRTCPRKNATSTSQGGGSQAT